MNNGNRVLQISLTSLVASLLVVVTFYVINNTDKGTDDNLSEYSGPIINNNYLCSYNYEVNDSVTGSWLKGTILFFDMGNHLEATVIEKFHVNNNPCHVFGTLKENYFDILSIDSDFMEDYSDNSFELNVIPYNNGHIMYVLTMMSLNGDGTAVLKLRSTDALEHGARQVSFAAGFYYQCEGGGQFVVDLPEWGS